MSDDARKSQSAGLFESVFRGKADSFRENRLKEVVLHAALLVPLRMRALTTLTDNSWGTRTSV